MFTVVRIQEESEIRQKREEKSDKKEVSKKSSNRQSEGYYPIVEDQFPYIFQLNILSRNFRRQIRYIYFEIQILFQYFHIIYHIQYIQYKLHRKSQLQLNLFKKPSVSYLKFFETFDN